VGTSPCRIPEAPNERSFFSPTPAGSGSKVTRTAHAKGYSLIEVLIGVTLLAFGLLALAGLQVTSIKGNFSSNNVTQAVYIAQDELENLTNLPLDKEALDPGKYDLGFVDHSGVKYKKEYSIEVGGTLMEEFKNFPEESNLVGLHFQTMRN